MDKATIIFVIILGIVFSVLCMCKINTLKENFNVNHGGYISNNDSPNNLENSIIHTKDYKLYKSHKDGMTVKEMIDLKKIINKILKKINSDLKLNFFMVEFDFVSKQEYNNGDERLILDIFIHEVHNFYNRRLILDVFIEKNKRTFYVNNITLGNAKQEKEIDNIPKQQKHNSNVLFDTLNKKNEILGSENTSLSFNLLDYKPKNFSNKNFTKWILPKKYINNINSLNIWPCNEELHKWDENGVSILKSNKKCGNNSSYTDNKLIPNFLPNMKNINYNSEYNWLFGISKTDGRNIFMGGRGHGVAN